MTLINSETGEIHSPSTPDPISMVVEQFRRGAFAQEAGIEFASLVRTCRDLQRSGSFTLKITIKPKDDMVAAEASFATAPPKSDPTAAIFWPDEDGKLLRNDPNQAPLFPFPQA